MAENILFDFSIKLILILVFFGLFIFRENIKIVIKSSFTQRKSNKLIELFDYLIESCKIKYNKFTTTVLLPLILVTLLFLFYYFVNARIKPENTNILNIIQTTVFSPVYEEIIFRGIFLALTILFFSYIAFNKIKMHNNIFCKWSINIWSLFLISLMFSVFHEFKIDIRYIGGLIYGLTYLLDKNNLLPAIIGHSLNNLLVIIIYS